jgi:hypothetical protein
MVPGADGSLGHHVVDKWSLEALELEAVTSDLLT